MPSTYRKRVVSRVRTTGSGGREKEIFSVPHTGNGTKTSRAYTLSTLPSLFGDGFFHDRVLQTICPGWV
jgi:hypothetical protein